MRSLALLRDERVIAGAIQIVVAVTAVAGLAYLADRTLDDMARRGLVPGIAFLRNTAGFAIGEGPAFNPAADTYFRALEVGLANTLRVAAVAIVLATGLGLAIAMGRLSGNPLAARLGTGFVEVFRNTPLIVQLLFWYQGVVLGLPALADSLALGPRLDPDGGTRAWLFLSQRGLALPRPTEGGFVLPRLDAFRYLDGITLTPEFLALAAGLTVYTAAFVAEVVRGGILSVPRGQRDAALAAGLREGQVLRHIVLPQALRVIVPPLTSQYLNLAKNSTLGIYVGYPDLFNVSLTVGNNTGQFVVLTAVIMATYLAISLTASLAMNLYNRRVQLVER